MNAIMSDIEKYFEQYYKDHSETNIIIETMIRSVMHDILKAASIGRSKTIYTGIKLPVSVENWMRKKGYYIYEKIFVNACWRVESIDVISWEGNNCSQELEYDESSFPSASQLRIMQQKMKEELEEIVWPALSESYDWYRRPIVINSELSALTRYHIENVVKFKTKIVDGNTILSLPIRAELIKML